jgi:hypothetical protein
MGWIHGSKKQPGSGSATPPETIKGGVEKLFRVHLIQDGTTSYLRIHNTDTATRYLLFFRVRRS